MSETAAERGAVFSDRMRRVVVAIGVMSLVATIGALVFGKKLAPPPNQPRDSYGHGALSHRAFLETLWALGFHAQRWTRPTHESVSAPLFVIEPNSALVIIDGREHDLAGLIRARITADRPTIVVLPKWEPGMMGLVEPVDWWRVEPLLSLIPGTPLSLDRGELTDARETITARDERGAEHRLDLRWPQRIVGGVPVLSDEHGAFVVRDPKSLVYVVAEPDLLHSFNVQRADHMAFWSSFLRDDLHTDTVVIDEVFHGDVQTRSLAELFAGWPGALALIHAGLIVVVILAMGRRRFGPPQPMADAMGRGPREVIDVAASVLANGTRVGTLATRYVEGAVTDLHRRLGLTEGKSIEQRAEQVDAAAQRRRIVPRARELLAKARALEGTRRAGDALAIAREAAYFRAKMVGVKSAAEGDAAAP